MGQRVEVQVPDIGDFKDVEVIEVLVKPGDTVKPEQSLITVESDKASMEIPSSAGGVVKELKVKLGDKISQGSPVVVLEGDAAQPAAPPTAAAKSPSPAAAPASAAAPAPASSAATTAAAAGGTVEVAVPDIGDFKEVEVIEVLVKPGDTIKQEQSLITVESDKASMEIPSSAAGVVRELRVKLGDKVSQGSPIALLSGVAGAAPAAPPPSRAEAPTPATAEAPKSTAFATEMGARPQPLDLGPAPGSKPHASPSVRKFARELGVDLMQVRGQRSEGSHHRRTTCANFVKAVHRPAARVRPRRRRAGRRRPGTQSAGVAGRRLCEVRSDRARRDVAHPQDLRSGAVTQLDH